MKKLNLKDCKGNAIKEGDIFRSYHYGGGKQGRKIHYLYHFVVWNSNWEMWFAGSACWDEKRQDGDGCCPMSYYENKINIKKVEIIGNIKEMPNFIRDQYEKVIEENKKRQKA